LHVAGINVTSNIKEFLLLCGSVYEKLLQSGYFICRHVKIYKSIILPVVLWECETWSLILREEHRLGVFENWMLRGIFGSEIDKTKGDWRKQNSEELNGLYWSPNIVWVIKSRRMRCAGNVVCVVDRRGIYRVLVGKRE
jgi:hypothetical protein